MLEELLNNLTFGEKFNHKNREWVKLLDLPQGYVLAIPVNSILPAQAHVLKKTKGNNDGKYESADALVGHTNVGKGVTKASTEG